MDRYYISLLLYYYLTLIWNIEYIFVDMMRVVAVQSRRRRQQHQQPLGIGIVILLLLFHHSLYGLIDVGAFQCHAFVPTLANWLNDVSSLDPSLSSGGKNGKNGKKLALQESRGMSSAGSRGMSSAGSRGMSSESSRGMSIEGSRGMSIERTYFITGGTDGIGKHTAQKLASHLSELGGGLIVHGRKPSADPAVESLLRNLQHRAQHHPDNPTDNPPDNPPNRRVRVEYVQADLNDLNEVESLASQVTAVLRRWDLPLNVLINNAGVFDPSPRFSRQGYDATLAVNVLAPFVLTNRLLPSLARQGDVRILTTSSISQSSTLPDLDRLFARRRPQQQQHDDDTFHHTPLTYSPHSFYSYSKLADLLFTVQLANLLSSTSHLRHVQCLTMDPGTVNTKMLLAGWGPCGIPVHRANNTFALATQPKYAHGGSVPSGSYHFGFRASKEANNNATLKKFWNKLEQSTGCHYDQF